MLAVLFVGVLLAALDIAIVGPALPAIRGHFRRRAALVAGRVQLSTCCSIWSARRCLRSVRTARAGAACSSKVSPCSRVGSLVAAAAWSFPALLLGRAIQAFGAGGLLPVAAAVIAETVPLERRGRTLGLIGAVFGVAFLLGPLLGGLLLRLELALAVRRQRSRRARAHGGAARACCRRTRAAKRAVSTRSGSVLLAVVLAATVDRSSGRSTRARRRRACSRCASGPASR